MNVIGIVFAVLLSAQVPQQAPAGTVQGTIVRVGTTEAVAGVQVDLLASVSSPQPRGGFFPAPEPRTATTDNNGRFVLRDVPAGRYSIRIQSNSYSGASTNPPAVTVTAGRTTDVKLSAIPGAVIRGRVRDLSGQFQSNTNVQAFLIVYQNGMAYLQPKVSKLTDDRGEFRLFGVPPGEYYIGVTPRPPLVNTTPMAGSVRNVQTYFPSATTPTKATRMTINGGEEISNIDIVVQTALHVRVSGRVISEVAPSPPVTDAPGVFATIATTQLNSATLQLVPRDANLLEEVGSTRTASVLLTASSGEFEIPNVAPGLYDLFASVYGQGSSRFGRLFVNVVDQDAAGLTIVVRPGVEVKGTVTVDGSVSTTPLGVSLQPLDTLRRAGFVSFPRPGAGDAPGSFAIPGVPQGRFRIVAGGGIAAYVEDILQNGRSIYDTGLDVGSSSPDPIQVVLKSAVSTVDGVVADAADKPVAGATVALIPTTRQENPGLFRSSTTDETGAFKFQGVAPGEYRLFAWPGPVNGAFYDPSFLSKFEESGRRITITPNSKASVRLSLATAR